MRKSIVPLGDSGIKVHFHEKVTPELNRIIQDFCKKLSDNPIDGVIEWVPAYDSVGIYYDIRVVSFKKLVGQINNLYERKGQEEVQASRLIHIPVVYGGEYGPDISKVADYNNCSESQVINMHQEPKYLIHMLGFLPGFPYLSGMTPEIATPRLENPRAKIWAGSVGIADQQTGIYPLESPGGWNIIGRTPIRLFDAEKEAAFLLKPWDYIQFNPVSSEEFLRIKEEVDNGKYEVEMEKVDGEVK